MATLTDFNIQAAYEAINLTDSGVGEEIARALLPEAAEDLRRMIMMNADKEFTTSQMSIYNHINNMSVSGVSKSAGGTYGVDLVLNGNLTRPSLSPKSSGVYDIVGLFINGWSLHNAKRRPWGDWHGRFVGARVSKPGMSFLDDAIEQFENKYGGTGITVSRGDY